MKVSVLLAVYNGEKYLKKSLQSVLDQTYSDFEVLIGFNGTTDNSKKIVDEFNDSRIRIFDYHGEKGKAKTLNKLIKECKGEWVSIQDDDDIWLPEKLNQQIKVSDSFDVVGTQIIYIDEEDCVVGKVELEKKDSFIKNKSLRGDNQVANTSAIVRKKCIEAIKGWREDLDGIEDFDLWLRLMRAEYKFVNLNGVFVYHRLHTKSNFNTKKYDLSLILTQEEMQQPLKRENKLWRAISTIFNR